MQFTSVCAGDPQFEWRPRLLDSRCFIVILLLGTMPFCFLKNARAAQRRMSQSGNLTLIVQPQIQLQEHGTDVVLKIRLAEGVNVKLWGSNSYEYPNEESKTFTASGTYTVSLQSLSAQGSTYACAVSSDGLLKASMLLQN
jgi:hypothetical protein